VSKDPLNGQIWHVEFVEVACKSSTKCMPAMPLDQVLARMKFMLLVSVFLHDLSALVARFQNGFDSPGEDIL
jgi:hypothetical protein